MIHDGYDYRLGPPAAPRRDHDAKDPVMPAAPSTSSRFAPPSHSDAPSAPSAVPKTGVTFKPHPRHRSLATDV